MQRFNFIYDLKNMHLNELRQLYARQPQLNPKLDLSELTEFLVWHASDNFAIREQQSNAIVAFAWLKIKDDCAYIMDAIIDGAYRCYGVGQLLLRHILTHPALEYCHRIELSPSADSPYLLSYGMLPWQRAADANASRVLSIESLLLGSFA